MPYRTAISSSLEGPSTAFGFWLTYVYVLPRTILRFHRTLGNLRCQEFSANSDLDKDFPALPSPKQFSTVPLDLQQGSAGCWWMRSMD